MYFIICTSSAIPGRREGQQPGEFKRISREVTQMAKLKVVTIKMQIILLLSFDCGRLRLWMKSYVQPTCWLKCLLSSTFVCPRLCLHWLCSIHICGKDERLERSYLVQLHLWRWHSSISQLTVSRDERETVRQEANIEMDLHVLSCSAFQLTHRTVVTDIQNTHTATAYEDDTERLQHPSSPHHPG